MHCWTKSWLVLTALATVAWSTSEEVGRRVHDNRASFSGSEARAVEFLTREVPAWSKSNGCFSCHNNGDGARALYAATRKGYRIDADVLKETTRWVSHPDRWDENKGDPGFADKHLANIQFSASLSAAFEAGFITDRTPFEEATRRLVADQASDGAWHIEPSGAIGSPATYGTPLATYMALSTLRKSALGPAKNAVRRAELWLSQLKPDTTLARATILLTSKEGNAPISRLRLEECLKLIRAGQTRDGGWGPYKDSPPEPFDTAVVLLALSTMRGKPDLADRIASARRFLLAQQQEDGGWAATTRPAGGESYAQRISTTGWVTLALLETR